LIAARKALLDAEKAAMSHDWEMGRLLASQAMDKCLRLTICFENLYDAKSFERYK